MDRILELAEQNGVYVQLVLSDHGQFATKDGGRWGIRCAAFDTPPCEPGDPGYDPGNSFSDANGGPVPLASPDVAFANADARDLMKQRLRYIVARWGAFRSVLAWELMNEMQFVGTEATNPYTSPQLRSDLVDWHSELAWYLKTTDPFGHLVTTSSVIKESDGALTELNAVWALPAVDLLQIHWYEPQPHQTTVDLSAWIDDLKARYGKPVIVGELGLLSPNPEPEFNPATFAGSTADREHLAQGTYLHNAMWSTAVSESASMYWWWGNYIAADPARNRIAPSFPLNERLVPPLVDFLEGEDWAPLDLDAAALTTSGPVVAVGSSAADRAYVWVRDIQNEVGTGARPGDLAGRTVSAATITLPVSDGNYRVRVFDTWGSSGVMSTFTAFASGGSLTVALPPFVRDVALKIDQVPGPPDADSDGIPDDLDDGQAAPGFTNVVDGKVNPTVGTVVSGSVTVEDHADPTKGVRVTAITDTVLLVCPFPTVLELEIPAGTTLTVTCGSVTVEEVSGGEVTVNIPGTNTSVLFEEGSSGTVSTQGGSVSLTGVVGEVTLSVGGVTVPVQEGGTNLIQRGVGSDTINGTPGHDVIIDAGGSNTINGKGGNDTIVVSGSGSDKIDGGDGDDTIDAGDGSNVVKGGAGSDQITAGSGSDTIEGSDGDDTIDAGNGSNNVKGGAGDDSIIAGSGSDTIDGGPGFDVCRPGGGSNKVKNCEG
jgi:Ca2+-binding RTX toxin-like protein